MSRDNSLLLAAVAVVAIVAGGVYALTGNNNNPAPSGSQVVQRQAVPVAAQVDSAVCGNAVCEEGEDGLTCPQDCDLYRLPAATDGTLVSYTDPESGRTFTLETADPGQKSLSGTVDGDTLNPEYIEMIFEDAAVTSTTATITGLNPSTVYHLYTDNYSNHQAITTDATGTYSFTQDTSGLHYVWIQDNKSTLFISTDTTLTANVLDSVSITADNITLDCAGFSIIGDGSASSGTGILISGRTGVTIKNCEVSQFRQGIFLVNSNRNMIIENNNVHHNRVFGGAGIRLTNASSNTIDNNLVNSNFEGIFFFGGSSSNNIISNNTVNSNAAGIDIVGAHTGNQILNNTIERSGGSGLGMVSFQGVVSNNLIDSNIISDSRLGGINFSGASNSNTFLNNILKNNLNVRRAGGGPNTWNLPAVVAGTNILGGSFLGGNAWLSPSGTTGFSETCTDRGDGICSSSRNIANGNADQFPLAVIIVDVDGDGIDDDVEVALTGSDTGLTVNRIGITNDEWVLNSDGSVTVSGVTAAGTQEIVTFPTGIILPSSYKLSYTVTGAKRDKITMTAALQPAPDGGTKSVILRKNNKVCILDPQGGTVEVGGFCKTSEALSRALIKCDGAVNTFSNFPDGIIRNFSCTQFGAFMKIDGLVFSSAEGVEDTDGDGWDDNADECPSVNGTLNGGLNFRGCPSALRVSVQIVDTQARTIVDQDLETRIFDTTSLCVSDFNAQSPVTYGTIFATCEAENFLLTKETNSLNKLVSQLETFGVTTGPKLVLVESPASATDESVSYIAFNVSLVVGEELDLGFEVTPASALNFQQASYFSKDSRGNYHASRKQTIRGSILEVFSPEYALWEGGLELYPFVFISDSDWTVDVCLEVPEGYQIVSPSECVQAFVPGEMRVIEFTVIEVGSPPPNVKVRIKATKDGKVKNIKLDIPGRRVEHKPKKQN